MRRLLPVFALVAAGLVFPDMSAAGPAPLADRTDPVIVTGGALPEALRGGKIESYRVFADAGSGLAAVPMQIEEVGEDGIVMVSKGPRPEPVDGKFDARDELVFMARDAGASAPAGPVEGCAQTAVVTIADRKTNAQGYVLVARCENAPPLSTKKYVSFDPAARTVTTDLYRFGWHEALVYAYDYITVNNGPDVLDRLNVRCSIGKFGIEYTFHEDDFRYTFLGYNEGPVRITWKADNYWSLGVLGRPVPQQYFFYDTFALSKNQMDTRLNPAIFGLDMSVEIGHDMSLDLSRGYSFCGNISPSCDPLDDTMTPEKIKQRSDRHMDWGGITGPEGALMIRLIPDSELNVTIKGKFIFDEKQGEPPEYIPGAVPKLSFYLIDWKDVKSGFYDLDFYYYFMKKYSQAEFDRLDRVTADPLAVKTEEKKESPQMNTDEHR